MSYHILVSIRWEPVRRVEVSINFPVTREGALSFAQATFRFRGTTYLAVADETGLIDVLIDQTADRYQLEKILKGGHCEKTG